ncbi:ammonium transporter [Paracoccus aminophilus]|uniref:Ammonium transporter n=1 Tax=Paracoccus aminophilus JCM 7686 TaxID=1367847 RepID=S5Y1N8_PARAH|nr:ammonium transporter [Paracoccus aminophilus]AGT11397.1 ammonium transporter [Paracoccus aminophilus JCM 7686]
MQKLWTPLLTAGLAAGLGWPALAQEAAPAAAPIVAAEAAKAVMDKGDTAWMMVSAVLVMAMILPGVALFYGGLVRAKNTLSVLMQTTAIAAVLMVLWLVVGYSIAFGGGQSPFWGGLGKAFLQGVSIHSTAATFTEGVVIPEYVFISFQMTFAAITATLIIGGLVERVKFGALLVFCIFWALLVYFPVAHMVWDSAGLIFGWGALDFAGGTVVHINAAVAALVGALIIGPRIGYMKEMMAPHSLPLALTGAAVLWFGWFGFNAGSALEAGPDAALAMVNTFAAPAAAILTWAGLEWALRGKASLLGGISGMISGLVAITPAAGTVGPMGALALGVIGAAGAYYFVTVVKIKLGYDDSLDVFGIHGVAGILGALGTGIFTAPSLGGTGGADYAILGQTLIQAKAVLLTVVWCGVVSFVLFKLIDATIGLRVSRDDERQGLDITTHGEQAYHL